MTPWIQRPFDGVLFDLDDTLHDDTSSYTLAARRVAERIAQERRVSADALTAAYVECAETFWARLSDQHLNMPLSRVRERMWRDALAAVDIDDAELATRAAVEYNRLRSKNLQLFPGVLPLLEWLRQSGLRTGLITNGFAETHREKLALLQLEQAFDATVLADEVGMVKPDPQIFLHACELVGVAPQNSVMVGDRYDRDIEGAARAGLATIWLNLHGAPLSEGRPVPDAIVPSFAAVCAALGASLRPSRNALCPGSV